MAVNIYFCHEQATPGVQPALSTAAFMRDTIVWTGRGEEVGPLGAQKWTRTFVSAMKTSSGFMSVTHFPRMELLRKLEKSRDETLGYFSLGDDDLSRTYEPGKWSIRYLLHHLADSEVVLYDRIARIISEPRQVLWVFHQEAWSQGLDYSTRPLEISRGVYAALRDANTHYAAIHYEKDGHLEYVHSVTGVRTLKDELEKVAAHNEHHLEHIRAALQK